MLSKKGFSFYMVTTQTNLHTRQQGKTLNQNSISYSRKGILINAYSKTWVLGEHFWWYVCMFVLEHIEARINVSILPHLHSISFLLLLLHLLIWRGLFFSDKVSV